MRLAWFSPAVTDVPGPSDDTALLIRALGARHEVDVVDAARAHDFVWQHARRPYDLCIFELGGTAAHAFIAAYAVHYPGIVLLRGVPRYDKALRGARLVVVAHEPVAQAVADDYPGSRVRTLAPGVEPLPAGTGSDVIEALRWPPDGAALTYAIAGFAAGRAVIVFDGPETADWPSLDPQTWHVRGLTPTVPGLAGTAQAWHHRGQTPICVSIDPRDEAHSLRLARTRLERDADLRARLGDAAHDWWRRHATVDSAAAGFERLIDEASRMAPAALTEADEGMTSTRRLLAELDLDDSALRFDVPP